MQKLNKNWRITIPVSKLKMMDMPTFDVYIPLYNPQNLEVEVLQNLEKMKAAWRGIMDPNREVDATNI